MGLSQHEKSNIKWKKVTLVNGFWFITPERVFNRWERYIGQSGARLVPLEEAYSVVSNSGGIKAQKITPYINLQAIVYVIDYEKEVEVVE